MHVLRAELLPRAAFAKLLFGEDRKLGGGPTGALEMLLPDVGSEPSPAPPTEFILDHVPQHSAQIPSSALSHHLNSPYVCPHQTTRPGSRSHLALQPWPEITV